MKMDIRTILVAVEEEKLPLAAFYEATVVFDDDDGCGCELDMELAELHFESKSRRALRRGYMTLDKKRRGAHGKNQRMERSGNGQYRGYGYQLSSLAEAKAKEIAWLFK